jgi:hypothetical protein
MRKSTITTALVLALGAAASASAAPVEFAATGAQPADIQSAVDAYRLTLGGNNVNALGPVASGRREINWDGIPDTLSAPNLMPANFFNNGNVRRGAVYFTPGSGFEVSAKAVTGTPILFGNISPNLTHEFQTFSPQRIFTALDSAVTEVTFFVPGTSTAASVSSFGSIFTNVTQFGPTKIEFYDVKGSLLHTQFVQPGPTQHASLSFAATSFDPITERVYLVRITSGNVELGAAGGMFPNPRHGDPVDLVAMDDFIYSEPQPLQ